MLQYLQNMRRRIKIYINPLARLGYRKYSYALPTLVTFFAAVILESIIKFFSLDPNSIALPAIFVFIALIVYFSFRDGIRGGVLSTLVTLGFYVYIVVQRQDSGTTLKTSLDTIITLGILYLSIALIIGWLKQTIDKLVENESNERRRLQAIIQQLPVGVVVADNTGRILHTNKQFEDIMGGDLPDDFIVGKGSFIESKKNNKIVTPMQSPLANAVWKGKKVVNQEFSINRDGREIFLKVNSTPIFNKQGKIVAACSIISDITAEKENEKRKDDFINIASHELKTPITSLKLYVYSLTKQAKKLNDKKIQETVERIDDQAKKMQELVNDLLDVSRIQTGKLIYKKEAFVINDLVEETIQMIKDTAPQKIIFKENRNYAVNADRFRIYQVLTNLLSNAIKYSPSDKNINVFIKSSKRDVTVGIQDQGIGVSLKDQKKIFERLYQVSEDTEKTYPGFGMGLYISKEIIKKHRGKIWVESDKGKGSIFYFSLPKATKGV
jgi:PAS domain S-box-containing protein